MSLPCPGTVVAVVDINPLTIAPECEVPVEPEALADF